MKIIKIYDPNKIEYDKKLVISDAITESVPTLTASLVKKNLIDSLCSITPEIAIYTDEEDGDYLLYADSAEAEAKEIASLYSNLIEKYKQAADLLKNLAKRKLPADIEAQLAKILSEIKSTKKKGK